MKTSYFLAGLILIGLYWIMILYQPFLLNIFISLLLVLSTTEITKLVSRRIKRPFLTSLISTIILGLLLFAPIVYFITTIAIQVSTLDISYIKTMVGQFNNWINTSLPDSLSFIKPYVNDLANSGDISKTVSSILNFIASMGAKSAGFIKDIAMIVIFYFFILFYGKQLSDFLRDLVPLHPARTLTLFSEASSVMSVVFYSILVTAIFEGALFGIIAAAYGYDALLFGVLYGFASLIPVVGGVLMWLPLSLYELSLDHTSNAVVIALYSLIMISIIADTFVKPVIIKYINIHFIKSRFPVNEMIIFFAILAGLTTFGFWGMIIGPAITTFFISVLNLYKEHRLNSIHRPCEEKS